MSHINNKLRSIFFNPVSEEACLKVIKRISKVETKNGHVQTMDRIIWQSIWSKLASWTYSGITLDIKVLSLWRTSYWYIEDKTYKKFERNPF